MLCENANASGTFEINKNHANGIHNYNFHFQQNKREISVSEEGGSEECGHNVKRSEICVHTPKGIVLLWRGFFSFIFMLYTVTYTVLFPLSFSGKISGSCGCCFFHKQRDTFYLQLNERNMLKIIKYMSIYVKIQW